VVLLYDSIEERVRDVAAYILENRATVRAAAAQFGISKSTVHKDMSERLLKIDPMMHRQVRKLMEINKAERHIRGGMATKEKYRKNKGEP